MYNSSSLIDAGKQYIILFPEFFSLKGMWILQKWRKSSSLQQLSMTDAKEIEDTFLFKLSRAPVKTQK